MNRRNALQQIGALALLASPSGFAFGQQKENFTVLKPALPTDVVGKIEVLEFFHYGCSHCQAFEPLVAKWSSRLPSDVAFVRVPVVWGEQLKNLARLHYALLIMKRLDLHEKVFVAVQEEREPLDKVDAVREWVKANGLDVSAFMGVYNSPALGPKVQRAIHLVSLYKIDSVPKLAVGGRFMTSAEMAGNDHEAALKIVDLLIERVRKGG